MSGIARRRQDGVRIRLITLTSAAGVLRDMAADYHRLVGQIRRKFGQWDALRVAEYTESGLVHYHILAACGFIAQSWLSAEWDRIHGAPVVDVRLVRQTSRSLARYVVAYLADGCSYSWTWGWVCKGFCAVWTQIKRQYGDAALGMWQAMLAGRYVRVSLAFRRPSVLHPAYTCVRSVYAAFGAIGLLTRASLHDRLDV